MNILVMNLEKLLEPLFLLFICRLDILWDRGSVNDAHSDLFLAHGVMARFSTTYNEELSQQCCPAVVASFSKSLINKPQIYLIYYQNRKQELRQCVIAWLCRQRAEAVPVKIHGLYLRILPCLPFRAVPLLGP